MRPESPGRLILSIQVVAWAAFVYLWARLSVKDWRDQKIQHRDLRSASALVAGAYALLALSTGLGALGVSRHFYTVWFYRDLAAHLCLSAAAAMGLWAARVWPAGDAKLFMFLSALLPLLSVSPSFAGGSLFFATLVNIFLPACLFVFAAVLAYLWRTRLKHPAAHLRALGLKRALDFLVEKAWPALRASLERARGDLLGALRDPLSLVPSALGWFGSMSVMAAVSATIRDAISSPAVRVLLGFMLMLAMSRLGPRLAGPRTLAALGAAAGLVPALVLGPAWRAAFVTALGQVSVFGLFLMMGMRWTIGAASGEVMMLVLPMAMALAGAIVPVVMSYLGMVPGAALSVAGAPWVRQLAPLAGMGAFFGLCWVLVRLWEDEDKPEMPPEKLVPYLVLHPSFVDRLAAEDPDFYERHFSTRYADGMTESQVKALRGWCRRHGIDRVAVQNTMSFAHWIFLGYFLTWLLGGHLVERWL